MKRALLWIGNGFIVSLLSGYGATSGWFWLLVLWVAITSEVVARHPTASAFGYRGWWE